ncbi:MAG: hypothetical protein AAB553_01465 [Patescibacteria group bacterium]
MLGGEVEPVEFKTSTPPPVLDELNSLQHRLGELAKPGVIVEDVRSVKIRWK